ncbi:Uncharacterised protein [Vibrio cholerae]|nr:Uncharacterised protein [Vibrio cholerae]
MNVIFRKKSCDLLIEITQTLQFCFHINHLKRSSCPLTAIASCWSHLAWH